MNGLTKAYGITKEQLADVKDLEEVCSRSGRLNMKLNWEMLEKRCVSYMQGERFSMPADDFLYYFNGRLVGFLGMYSMGKNAKVIEITGMVHPDYRRKGIFSSLFSKAQEECATRGIGKLLLITERHASEGKAFMKSVGAGYDFSEYRMVFKDKELPQIHTKEITLRKPHQEEFLVMKSLDAESFGDGMDVNEIDYTNIYGSTSVIDLDGGIIGKIGTLMENGAGYVFGFVVMPEYRGKGYGRAALILVLKELLEKGMSEVFLEVAAVNDNALGLYKSCGFGELTTYDYYIINRVIDT